jgi:3-oxoacyl-[acyl-carrier protein] reductase
VLQVTFDFSDAHVLVTGGSNGIGLGVARAFAAAGATVTITGTRPAASDYEHDLSAFRYHQCDMRDRAQVEALAAGLERLDVLVNNAGRNLRAQDEWNPDTFEESVAINLLAPFRLASLCHPLLAASTAAGGASVVNVASLSSLFAVEPVPGYGAAKAGVVQMTKSMAVRWAGDAIRVNAVAPGVVESNMTAALFASQERTAGHLERTPLGRLGVPEDIAPVVLFLASPAAGYMTGQTVFVDGGNSVKG